MNNRDFAEELQVSEATVSRLASGNRNPSVALMLKIKELLRWPIDKQAQAITEGTYGEQFREKLDRRKPPKAKAA